MVRRAGEVLIRDNVSPSERENALSVVDYWRYAHQGPMGEALDGLAQVSKCFPHSILTSRLKRIDTIERKLKRGSYKLNSMYDIAGCRLVVNCLSDLYDAVVRIEEEFQIFRKKDYMTTPKPSGYSGMHIITSHDSDDCPYSGLKVEIQIRTKLHHVWATSVEVYDLIKGGGLKFGESDEMTKRFFWFLSRFLSTLEIGNGVATIDDVDCGTVVRELKTINAQTGILNKLEGYNQAISFVDKPSEINDSCIYLVKVDFGTQLVDMNEYHASDIQKAVAAYGEAERKKEPTEDVLLVRASSVDDFVKAYPNYSSDMGALLEVLDQII